MRGLAGRPSWAPVRTLTVETKTPPRHGRGVPIGVGADSARSSSTNRTALTPAPISPSKTRSGSIGTQNRRGVCSSKKPASVGASQRRPRGVPPSTQAASTNTPAMNPRNVPTPTGSRSNISSFDRQIPKRSVPGFPTQPRTSTRASGRSRSQPASNQVAVVVPSQTPHYAPEWLEPNLQEFGMPYADGCNTHGCSGPPDAVCVGLTVAEENFALKARISELRNRLEAAKVRGQWYECEVLGIAAATGDLTSSCQSENSTGGDVTKNHPQGNEPHDFRPEQGDRTTCENRYKNARVVLAEIQQTRAMNGDVCNWDDDKCSRQTHPKQEPLPSLPTAQLELPIPAPHPTAAPFAGTSTRPPWFLEKDPAGAHACASGDAWETFFQKGYA